MKPVLTVLRWVVVTMYSPAGLPVRSIVSFIPWWVLEVPGKSPRYAELDGTG